VTGPVLRSAGLPWDLRKTEPYLGYETYDFEVPTCDRGRQLRRYLLRLEEMRQSLRIVTQALDRLEPGPVMVEDRKIAWPAQLALGPDGLGNSLDHVKKIMGQSMESLIHHFKLVTEGFRVPPGQVFTEIESPRGAARATTWSPTAGPDRSACTSATPRSSTCRRCRRWWRAACSPTSSRRSPSIDPVMGGVDR
jgi:NADH-quinone oxidoreductase subunit D